MSNFLIAFGAIIMFLGTSICVALTIILLCKNKKAMPFIIGIFGSMIVGGILLGIGCVNQPKSEHKKVAYNTTEMVTTEKPQLKRQLRRQPRKKQLRRKQRLLLKRLMQRIYLVCNFNLTGIWPKKLLKVA